MTSGFKSVYCTALRATQDSQMLQPPVGPLKVKLGGAALMNDKPSAVDASSELESSALLLLRPSTRVDVSQRGLVV